MLIPLTYLYLNDDKIQVLYDATSNEIIGEKKVTKKGNVKGSIEVNAETSYLTKLLMKIGGRGSGEAGKERTEEYVVAPIPIPKKLQSLESYFIQKNIRVFNLNKEKEFEKYVSQFITATIPFRGTIREEFLDLKGKLDVYSVHMLASKRFFKTQTGPYRITQSMVPTGLNVFGTLRGIDVNEKIIEIDPIAF